MSEPSAEERKLAEALAQGLWPNVEHGRWALRAEEVELIASALHAHAEAAVQEALKEQADTLTEDFAVQCEAAVRAERERVKGGLCERCRENV